MPAASEVFLEGLGLPQKGGGRLKGFPEPPQTWRSEVSPEAACQPCWGQRYPPEAPLLTRILSCTHPLSCLGISGTSETSRC